MNEKNEAWRARGIPLPRPTCREQELAAWRARGIPLPRSDACLPAGRCRKQELEAGFTFIEVIVTMILVTLVGASVLMSFVNASRWADPSLLAAVFDARGELDQLNEEVRNDTWNSASNDLSIGTHPDTLVTVGGRTYTQSYEVTSVPLGGVADAYRKVVVTESWSY